MLKANMDGGALSERAIEVGSAGAVLRFPGDLLLVSEYTGDECRPIVAAKADEHDAELGHLRFGLNCVLLDNVLVLLQILIEEGVPLLVL